MLFALELSGHNTTRVGGYYWIITKLSFKIQNIYCMTAGVVLYNTLSVFCL